ncbi:MULTISPECIES: DUF2061 domain-containing protein [Pseudovibrio]|uniref:DUF2061 domain-containing protein n=1 Tax=Stappiaceae TaxID=2821832 RepID=UPI002365C764|nr:MULTISPECIES: DUF2061 domain-containing protein [Pseudovibrio]MDD7911053.1 DUF2061 domain-containing protein [Pseudovibrio exalbescens]MDX5593224.1 DUF2061 domain-containing protein [Pseudovibrio sp. SPO723]
MDTQFRTIVKACFWQITGLVVMMIVGFLFTGSYWTGGLMALVNAGLGFMIYFIYERIWAKIDWGRVEHQG